MSLQASQLQPEGILHGGRVGAMSHAAAVGSHGQPGERQVCASCLDGLQREAEQKSMPEIFRKFNKCY